MIISKFLRSSDGASILTKPAQVRLKIFISILENLSFQLADGSIVLSEFRALQPKEEQLVTLANNYMPQQPTFEWGHGPESTLPKTSNAHLYRIRDSFAECRARLYSYDEQRVRIKNFVDNFQNFPQIGKIAGFTYITIFKSFFDS